MVDRSKVAKKARRKGSGFERKVCKLLEDLTGYEFKRTPLSGGWAKEKISGDVICLDDSYDFKWSVECKNQEGWNLEQLLNPINNKGETKVFKWWQQCKNDAFIKNKFPMLIFTRNHQPIYCMATLSDLGTNSYKLPEYFFKYSLGEYSPTLVIFLFEKFIEINK